jgi:hypothetical protein
MNLQLLSHLETFDSDEEFSESPGLHEEEHIGAVLHDTINPFDEIILKAKASLRRFVKPKSLKEAFIKLVWLLPVGIALGDFIGLLLSLNLSLICLVLMQLKSDPPREESQEKSTKIVVDTEELWADDLAQKKKQVHDCRKEVSRLLGLVGAPPLEWEDLETDCTDLANITDAGTISVVKFLEAHVQFLLTVDEAFHWIQVSASLHLGLGPRSQCVERVERASIAREFRNRRRQSIGATLILDGVDDSALEPQRGVSKSVLSLSLVRKHLAKAIVDQSNSLIQVWKAIRNAAETAGSPGVFPRVDLLDMPDVIDLTWIKGARQQLAALLSHLVDHFCSLDVLLVLALSQQLGPRSRLDESMWNARNAREHLLCNLLLGKKRNAKPLPKPNDKLMLSLVQYREQLDALSGALWSCQQYVNIPLAENDYQLEAKSEWWSQVKQLGATCRALENEIGQTFFPTTSPEDDEDGVQDESESMEGNQGRIPKESGSYEHGPDGRESRPAEKKEDDKPTKTMVFKGQGAVVEFPPKGSVRRNGGNGGGDEEALSLPQRDAVSEQMLVKELQNRITTFRPPEDDEEEEESEAEKAAKAARAPTNPLFLGASGSLLSELKLSMPSTGGSEEHILGE